MCIRHAPPAPLPYEVMYPHSTVPLNPARGGAAVRPKKIRGGVIDTSGQSGTVVGVWRIGGVRGVPFGGSGQNWHDLDRVGVARNWHDLGRVGGSLGTSRSSAGVGGFLAAGARGFLGPRGGHMDSHFRWQRLWSPRCTHHTAPPSRTGFTFHRIRCMSFSIGCDTSPSLLHPEVHRVHLSLERR